MGKSKETNLKATTGGCWASSKIAIVVFGAQGSGKSTQTEALSHKYHLPILSMGERLRELVEKGGPLGECISRAQRSGKLVEPSIVAQVVTDFIEHTSGDGIIFDAFPRDFSQIPLLEDLAHKRSWRVVAINLVITDQTALKRLMKRTTIVDGEAVRRDDDTEELILARLELFHQQTEPMLDWLRKKHIVIDIDGEPPIDEVTKMVLSGMERCVVV